MKKSLLFVISLGIISATAFGATAASWAVTDNADPFGVKVSVTEPTEEKALYLNGGGSSLWNQANAQFYVHIFGSIVGEGSQDLKMTACAEANYYKIIVPENYTQIIFTRCKPEMTTFDWNDVWNKTADLTIPTDNKDTYTITGWEPQGSDACPGTWSEHTCVAGTPVKENNVEPTCEVDGGYDMVTHCTICNEIMNSEHTVVPAIGHDWAVTYSWNTEHTSVTGNAICENDPSHTLTETTTNITSVEEIAPTCTTLGTTKYTATFTNTVFGVTTDSVQNIPMIDHIWSTDYHHNAQDHFHYCTVCGAEGTHEAHHGGQATEQSGAICEVCHFVYTEPLAHTHSYVEHPAVAATCTQSGNSLYYTCTGCSKIFNSNKEEISEIPVIAPLGHQMIEHPAVAATCTQPGNSLYYSCSRCGKYFSDSQGNNEIAENSWIIPATGHHFDTEWTSNDTHHWHVCSDCDEKSNYGTHTWDAGVITVQPTYTTKGVKTYTCTVCSKTKTEEIDYLIEYRVFLEGSNTNRGQSEGHDYETQLNDIGDGWYYHDYDLGNCYVRVKVEEWKNNTWIKNSYPYNSGYYYQITNGGHTTGGVAYNKDNPTAAWTKSSQWDNYGNLRYVQKPSS